jgi:hypothetical protein
MTDQEIAARLLAVVRVLATSRAVTDTLWISNGMTLVDQLLIIEKAKGYKTGWAQHVYAARLKKQRDAADAELLASLAESAA